MQTTSQTFHLLFPEKMFCWQSWQFHPQVASSLPKEEIK
jgi:hypothetical protein